MHEPFADMLAVGGKKNSLGRVNDVITLVLNDQSRIAELYTTIFNDDAWVRMRAIDAFEKISRDHPEWIVPYITNIQQDLESSSQPSIQWHIAQIYSHVSLTDNQKAKAIIWLKTMLSTPQVDWIVAANCMETLAQFTRNGDAERADLVTAATVQQHHKSNAVIKRAKKLLSEFS